MKKFLAYGLLCLISLASTLYLYHFNIESKIADARHESFFNSVQNTIAAIFYLIPEKQLPNTIAIVQAKTKVQIVLLQLQQLKKQGYSLEDQIAAAQLVQKNLNLLLKEIQKLDAFTINATPAIAALEATDQGLVDLEFYTRSLDIETQDTGIIQSVRQELKSLWLHLNAAEFIQPYSPESALFYMSQIQEPLDSFMTQGISKRYIPSESFEPRIKSALNGLVIPLQNTLHQTDLANIKQNSFARISRLQQQIIAVQETLKTLPAPKVQATQTNEIVMLMTLALAFISSIRISLLIRIKNEPASQINPQFQQDQDHHARQKAIMELIRQQEQLKRQLADETRVAPSLPPEDNDQTRIMP